MAELLGGLRSPDLLRSAAKDRRREAAPVSCGGPLSCWGERIRDLQDETGGFTAFISWTFQHDHTDMPDVPETFAEEYLHTLEVRSYLTENLSYFLREPEVQALEEYYRRAYAQGLIPEPRALTFWE